MSTTHRARPAAAGALACGLLLAGCGSHVAPPTATSTSAPASPTVAAFATAPASSECASFAQVYNGQVGPVLKGPGGGGGGNVYLTEITDAFQALAATVSAASDPYSQTIAKDAQAVAVDPTSLGALATFNTDLAAYLKACGMSSS